MKKTKNKQIGGNCMGPNEISQDGMAHPPLFCPHKTWTKSVAICVIFFFLSLRIM